MKSSSMNSCSSADATKYAATLRPQIKRYARNCMPALVAGTSLSALLIIALHVLPSKVLPPDRGHPSECDLMRCW
jgi:hypothetical protein